MAVGEDHVDATALVLVDIAPRIELDGVKKIQAFMSQKPEGFDSLDEVADGHRRPTSPTAPGPATSTVWPRTSGSATTAGTTGTGTRGSAPGTATSRQRQARLEACARNLTLPTLLVRGGLSDILSEEGAQSFLDLCPHSEYVNVSGAAHMVAGDRNDIFATAVIEFLSRAVPVDGTPVQPPHEPHPHHEGPTGDILDVP